MAIRERRSGTVNIGNHLTTLAGKLFAGLWSGYKGSPVRQSCKLPAKGAKDFNGTDTARTLSCFRNANSQYRKCRDMTDKKTPLRRITRSAAAKPVGDAVKSTAKPTAPKPSAAKTKPASRTKAAVAGPGGAAKKAPSAARASAAKPAPTKSAPTKPAVSKPAVANPAAPKARVLAPARASLVRSAAAPVSGASPTPRIAPAKGNAFKLRMLIDQVIKSTGGKKKPVKEAVEATLSRIGEALARGDELNLPGFGKVRVVKNDDKDGTAIMTLKLRQGTAKPGTGKAKQGLADTGDDD